MRLKQPNLALRRMRFRRIGELFVSSRPGERPHRRPTSPLDSATTLAQTLSVNPDDKTISARCLSAGRCIGSGWAVACYCAAIILVSLPRALAAVDPAHDWPNWRGPTRDGIAAPGQNPPLHWSETEGVLWKAAIPGRGH